ncbi:MAG: hypothetical protein WCE75_05905, partial [Terracidiphilus sp.]
MAKKTIPWWRRAIDFALKGLRTGFGLFNRQARPEDETVAAEDPPPPVAVAAEPAVALASPPEPEAEAAPTV